MDQREKGAQRNSRRFVRKRRMRGDRGEGRGQKALGKKEVAEFMSLHYSTGSRFGKAWKISRIVSI
jgi:hypothetical protein